MGRPPVFSPETKTRIVLSVLSGEIGVAEVARKEKVSQQSIGRWRSEFLEAGKTALAAGKLGLSTREAQVEDLTLALGETAVERRVWTKSASLMLLLVSSGVEECSVGGGEGCVEACASFEFADAWADGSEVDGDLGESQSALVAEVA